MKRAVITYIFGRGKELLREPLVVDKDIEYICVTDQKDLKSKTWKIVHDDINQAGCTRDKMVYVKYNPFKYTTANEACVVDGSIQIKASLHKLFEQLKDKDVLIKQHPERTNLYDELQAWVKLRNLPKEYITKFEHMSKYYKISLTTNFLLESCVLVFKNTNAVQELCESVIALMKFLGEKPCLFLSNQCCLTYLLQTLHKNIKYDWLKQALFFVRYKHNTLLTNTHYNK